MDTRRKLEQCATQPTQIPAQDAGAAIKPKQNTNNRGRQATYTTAKQAASSCQSADGATPVQAQPTATTFDASSSPPATGDSNSEFEFEILNLIFKIIFLNFKKFRA